MKRTVDPTLLYSVSPDFLRYVSHAPYNVDDAPLELGDGLQRQLAEVGRPCPRPLQQESQGSHCRDLDEGETRLLESIRGGAA